MFWADRRTDFFMVVDGVWRYILGKWGWVDIFYGLVAVGGVGWTFFIGEWGCVGESRCIFWADGWMDFVMVVGGGWRYTLGKWVWVDIFYGLVGVGGVEWMFFYW